MRAFAAVAALFFTSACQAAPPPEPDFTAADRQAVAEEVKQASEAWIAAWARNDIDAAMAALVHDLAAYFVGDPGIFLNNLAFVPDAAGVEAGFASAREARSSTGIFPSEESIAVLSRDHAVQVWVAEWNVTDAQGVTTPNYPLTATLVWVRQEGTWRIVHWHQTWNQNPV